MSFAGASAAGTSLPARPGPAHAWAATTSTVVVTKWAFMRVITVVQTCCLQYNSSSGPCLGGWVENPLARAEVCIITRQTFGLGFEDA